MSLSARRGRDWAFAPGHVLAYRLRAQRLEQRTPEPLPQVVRAIGYVATPGGATPYLALRARSPRFDRRLVERATFEAGELVEVPAPRGGGMLVPLGDAAAVLTVARPSLDEKLQPLARAGLLDARKLARIEETILGALGPAPLSADELRVRLPQPLSVSLGEAGRKAGFGSLFAVSLRCLLAEGRVVRRPREHRFDREAFVYLPAPAGLAPPDRPAALAQLADRYFRAYPASSASAFGYWADANAAETREALAEARVEAVALEGAKEPGFVAADERDDFLAFEPPSPARLAFVPFRDPAVSGARDLKGLLSEANRSRALADWRGRLVPAGGGSAVHQHFVLHGGYVAGIWEYDEDERRVRYETFDPLPTRMRRAADDAAEELAAFVTEQLGVVRFYEDERADGYGRLEDVVAAWRKAKA